MEGYTRDAVREPPMARDFFRSSSRDLSPQYRWARRSRRSTSSADKEPDTSSFGDFTQRASPPRSPAPAPQVLNRTSSRSKRVEAGIAAPPAAAAASGSVLFGPGRAVGGKLDGAASPRGPLDFPASPVSSPGSFKEAPSPASSLTPVRSRRSPSPQRGPPRQGLWVQARSPGPAAVAPRPSSSRHGGVGQAGAQGSSPPAAQAARQEAVQTPPKMSVADEAVARGSPAHSARDHGPERAAGTTTKTAAERPAKPEARGGGRSSTPFRRGLNAIKGRLFSDSRKAASVEISRTQQDLGVQHKVKPAASSGVKESLVHRLTRAFQRPGQPARSRFLPAPPAAPLAPPATPTPEVVSPPSAAQARPPEPPKTLAPPNAPGGEPPQKGHRLEEARVGTAVAMGGAGQGSEKEGLLGNDDQEGGVGDRCVEGSDLGPLRSPDVNGGTEAGATGGAGVMQGVQGSGEKVETSSPNDSSAGSDSDSEGTRARSLPRTRSAGSPASQVRYASWAQHIPPAVSPAVSWDSQSSTEFANTRRPSHVQRLLSSESSGSEQGSPRYARSPLGSPPGASFGGRPASEQSAPPATACPSVASPEALLPAASSSPSPSPPRQAPTSRGPRAVVRRSLDALGWSSDEDAEEDRSARKREMAAALRQLKSFQAGGSTPRPAQAPLQRSFTDPAAFQVVKRTASPMRTLWRQATAAAASLEGPASSARRLSLSAAGRALSRSRDRSPCPPGLLASPRRLRPEASPQRAASLFEDGPRARESRGAGLRGAAGAAGAARRASQTPSRGRPISAAAAFFRSFTPGRQRPTVL